nr:LuxR C-terminal-related transcriptional regulator [Amycolatopsis nigrescens]
MQDIPTRQGVSPDGRPAEYRDIFRSLFEQSGLCMANLDLRLRVLDANRYFIDQFGRSAADVRGHGFFEFLHPSVRAKLKTQFSRLTEGRNPRFTEKMVAIGPEDSLFAGELTGIAVRDDLERVDTFMVLMRPDGAARESRMVTNKDKLLSQVDARILEGVAAGESTVQLAAKLYLSRGGVEYHVTNLLRKLKVTNRPALVSKGYSMGLLGVGLWPPRVLPEYIK